jgi:hypothetical protein
MIYHQILILIVFSFMLRRVIVSLFWMTVWLVSSLKFSLVAFILLNTDSVYHFTYYNVTQEYKYNIDYQILIEVRMI